LRAGLVTIRSSRLLSSASSASISSGCKGSISTVSVAPCTTAVLPKDRLHKSADTPFSCRNLCRHDDKTQTGLRRGCPPR
jgi:hypothetical protein